MEIMKVLVMWVLLGSLSVAAQSGVSARVPPRPVADIIQLVPSILHNNPKAELAPYLEEIRASYKTDPSVLNALGPVFASNLSDPDPVVQAKTLGILYGLTVDNVDPSLELSLSKSLASLLGSRDEYTQRMAILVISNMREAAPDVIISGLTSVLQNAASSADLSEAAAGVLMISRPNDVAAEDAVVSAINDPKLPIANRKSILHASANSKVGVKIVDNVVKIANASIDRELRDTAIGAAIRIGSRGLVAISATAQRVSQDHEESEQSRQIASYALEVLARSAH